MFKGDKERKKLGDRLKYERNCSVLNLSGIFKLVFTTLMHHKYCTPGAAFTPHVRHFAHVY
jgi:hypothetical protein